MVIWLWFQHLVECNELPHLIAAGTLGVNERTLLLVLKVFFGIQQSCALFLCLSLWVKRGSLSSVILSRKLFVMFWLAEAAQVIVSWEPSVIFMTRSYLWRFGLPSQRPVHAWDFSSWSWISGFRLSQESVNMVLRCILNVICTFQDSSFNPIPPKLIGCSWAGWEQQPVCAV